jgi:tetratricopeptide (TPR) repeat protein
MAGDDASTLCNIYLFGALAVTDAAGASCTPKAQKSRALMAMLALAPRGARSRIWLRDKLWSDRGEEQAAASLRQALVDVRKSLGPIADSIIISDNHTISLDLNRVSVDALQLLDLSRQSVPSEVELESWPELLEGLDIGDPEFEEWLMLERQVWQGRLENALGQRDVSPKDRRSNGLIPVQGQKPGPNSSDGGNRKSLPLNAARTGWSVALLPPAISGDAFEAESLPDMFAELLVRSLLEGGELTVSDLSRPDLSAAQEPDATFGSVALAIQVRYRFSAHQAYVSVSVHRTADRSLLWMGGATLERRAVEAGETSAAHQLINEAMDELRKYFIARSEQTDDAIEAESLYAAVNAMFRLSRNDLVMSEASLRRIIAQRPSSQAYAWLAFLMTFQVGQRFSDSAVAIEQAQHYARKALELDSSNSVTLALVGHVHSFLFGEYDYASGLFERAIRANPTQVLGWDLYSMLHAYAGQPGKGLSLANWARHLGAYSPYRYYFDTSRLINATLAGNHRVAIEASEQALRERPDFNSLLRYLVASHAQLGDIRAARSLLDRLNVVEPNFSISSLIDARYPIMRTEGGANLISGLIKAGVKKT